MSNPTTPFSWQMPTATDLVTDLPADFEVFGQAVATSMADLLGGTTGQVLSKTSNTDMDFTWVAANPGDITGVTAGVGITGGGTSGTVTVTNDMATTITASGDIVVGTGSGTYDNLPIGTTGQILTADTTVSPYKVKWATPAASASGLTRVVSGSFTASAGLSVNSCFTSTYKNYKVVFRVKASTTAGTIAWRWRASGTDQSSGYYYGWNLTNNNGTTTLYGANNSSSIDLGGITETGYFNNYSYDVFGPQAATQVPSLLGCGTFTNAGQRGFGGGLYAAVVAYDGFSLVTSQNITGEYVVYGYED
jgi:hypothetical protein